MENCLVSEECRTLRWDRMLNGAGRTNGEGVSRKRSWLPQRAGHCCLSCTARLLGSVRDTCFACPTKCALPVLPDTGSSDSPLHPAGAPAHCPAGLLSLPPLCRTHVRSLDEVDPRAMGHPQEECAGLLPTETPGSELNL